MFEELPAMSEILFIGYIEETAPAESLLQKNYDSTAKIMNL